MASCSFSSVIEDADGCGQSLYLSSTTVTCVSLNECQKDVTQHLNTVNVYGDDKTDSEMKLILARAGIFCEDETQKNLTICPRHRDVYGLRWRCNKRHCAVPPGMAAHKSKTVKGDRGIDFAQSALISQKTGTFVPIGSPICRRCRQHISQILDEMKKQPTCTLGEERQSKDQAMAMDCTDIVLTTTCVPEQSNQREVRKTNSLEKESDSSDSTSEDIAEKFQDLTLDSHDTIYMASSETASTASSVGKPDEADEQKSKLNDFLISCKVKPLGNKSWVEWSSASESTRRRYLDHTADAVAGLLKVLSTENACHLWEALQTSKIVNEKLNIESPFLSSERVYLEALAESYKIASSWDTRRQILSLMAGVASYKAACEFIPGLTSYRYTIASLHRLQHGPGVPVPVEHSARFRVTKDQLDHFLEFITSPHLVQDLPFGEKTLVLSTGESIVVPNVIRTMIPQRIVQQYKGFCEETDFVPFSESTMLRILSSCTASVRKSLQGLDYFAADGSKAFEDLAQVTRIVSPIGPGKEWEKSTEDSLKAGKMYLQGDYKVHIREDSCIPDHCCIYALSDPEDESMRQTCNHAHTDRCGKCEALDQLLDSIEKAVQGATFPLPENRDEALYLFQHARQAIILWKCHQIRTVRQDQARLDVLDRLDDKTCLITNDWAMKFLPHRYRETQSDWFGKRGISWHISVVVRRVSAQLETQTFVHILQSSNQGSFTVVLLLEHVLRTLKSEHPEIQQVFLRQDNAGCYHSAPTILAIPDIQSSSGMSILAVDFSDPQGGKGPADRMSATCKNHIRRYINEGHDVTTAEQMKIAILSHGGVEGVRVAVVEAPINETPEQRKIPGINKLNNFDFKEDGVFARRAYAIGKGRKITVKEGQGDSLKLCWLRTTFSNGDFKSLTKPSKQARVTQPEENAAANTPLEERPTATYSCPQDGCTRVFQRHRALENHLSFERCSKSVERVTLLDSAKQEYATRLLEGVGKIPSLPEISASSVSKERLKEGWALKQMKKPYRFSDKQKSYLVAKFNVGQNTGRKMDPEVVAKEMRREKDDNGVPLFTISEFLTPLQVSSFFSRLAAKVRQRTVDEPVLEEEDITAASEEENFANARESVLASLNLAHPIVCGQNNFCELVRANSLSKLKLGDLQFCCTELGLPVPVPPVRRKAPYVNLLQELVQGCTCMNLGSC